METAKNAVKAATGSESQFESGHQVPIHHQAKPGLQADMKGPEPASTEVPKEDGGYQSYKAAGKLIGKKAVITGGDSGIGRAISILFALEGADSLITYLPEELKDAQVTKQRVEEEGRKCFLIEADLRDKKRCREVIDTAVKQLGGVNILVNNAGTQAMVEDIADLSE
ncbi:MAG: hypothetical protein M1825_001163 [Sarcosagium campestre]|nr:MAG: hypothetical protein M1825_001163 [Sarcosagium campestre]